MMIDVPTRHGSTWTDGHLPDGTSKSGPNSFCVWPRVCKSSTVFWRCLDSCLELQAFPTIPAATQLQGHAMRLMGRHHDRSEDLLCSLFDKEVTGGGILKGVEGVPAHFFPICMGKC